MGTSKNEIDVDGVAHRGFLAWLLVRVVWEDFHLNELFNYSKSRWLRAVKLFGALAQRDPRYGAGFQVCCTVEFDGQTLRQCLVKAGLSEDAAKRCLHKVNGLGFSGRVPPKYWLNREAIAMTWGATDEELARFLRRIDTGKPVKLLRDRWRAGLRPALRATRRALSTFGQSASLPTAPVTWQLSAPEPVATAGAASRKADRDGDAKPRECHDSRFQLRTHPTTAPAPPRP